MSRHEGYHHRNLHSALLTAAEAELVERGVEHFSLRGVARRAGVSHAAPAHHFGDVDGLLTALATLSFQRFLKAMENAAEAAGPDAVSRLVGIGMGYIDYAETNPELFSLQFASERPECDHPELRQRAEASFALLQSSVQAVVGDTGDDPTAIDDACSLIWATTHGLAALFAMRRRGNVAAMSDEARHERFRRLLGQLAESLRPATGPQKL